MEKADKIRTETEHKLKALLADMEASEREHLERMEKIKYKDTQMKLLIIAILFTPIIGLVLQMLLSSN